LGTAFPSDKHEKRHADMLELVDKSDLGSDEFFSWGFKSLYPYGYVAQLAEQ
jgi:hypothetical protein